MKDFGIPNVAAGKVIPGKIEEGIRKDIAREEREKRRFVISTTISIISAVGATIGAVFGILAFFR